MHTVAIWVQLYKCPVPEWVVFDIWVRGLSGHSDTQCQSARMSKTTNNGFHR